MKSAVEYMNKAGRGEMPSEEGAEWDWPPAELCVELGMLILEGRKPEQSVKGRTEGHHCPPARGTSKHQCKPGSELCAQMESVYAYINFLCRNDIPVSVEVLLYPDCCRGNQSWIEVGASAEGGREQPPGMQEYIVLEQWIIQVLPKRFPDGYTSFHMLMQAVRSFLHFSQLSAWLCNTQGTAPTNIVYRVCAHGESFAENTQVKPELHTFPILNISKSTSIQVTVASLPRQPAIPQPRCYSLGHNKTSGTKTKAVPIRQKAAPHSKREDHGKHKHPQGAQGKRDEYSRSPHLHRQQDTKSDYVMHKHLSDVQMKSSDSDRCKLGGNVPNEMTQRGSNVCDWNLEAIQQTKARLRNEAEFKDTPEFSKRSETVHKPDKCVLEKKERKLPEPVKGVESDFDDMFTPMTSIFDLEQLKVGDSSKERVCYSDEMKYHEKLVELEQGLSSLKLHHIPATPCTAFCMPQGESFESRNTSVSSAESDLGIVFTAQPSNLLDLECDTHNITYANNRKPDKDIDQYYERKFGCSSAPADQRDVFDDVLTSGYSILSGQPFSKELSICHRSGLECMDQRPKLSESSDTDLFQTPPEYPFNVPVSGTAVSALDSATARTRHGSGASQDSENVPHNNSPNHKTSSNPCAIPDESQCFNAAVFKTKALQESNSGKSSPILSPVSSPRRSSKLCGCNAGWDDFKANISAPFGNGGPQASKDKENHGESAFQFPPSGKDKSLLRNVLNKGHQTEEASTQIGRPVPKESVSKANLRRSLDGSSTYVFHPRTGLPINSSPAPLRKTKTTNDCPSLLKPIGLTSSPSCNNLEKPSSLLLGHPMRMLSTSAPATSCLLGNFEESVLNGRLEPLGTIDGFTAEIGASGSFCPKHVCLPVTTFFYSVCDDDAPSSYFGHINLESLGKRGYHVPKCGTIQVTLFNPNKTVVKMFVIRYDLVDMPPNCQTFARQRIFYMPSDADVDDDCDKELRYLIHLRFQTSKSGKIYLHTDIRIIFARHSPDLESSFGTFELRSFTEVPTNPRFSPKK